MTRFVGTPLRGIEFASNSDEAISTRIVGDAHAKIRIDAGGRITWSSGSAAGDTNIYRDSANVLKTDDVFIGAGGIVTIATDGAPTAALANGAVAVDITNNVFYFRSDDEWIQVANSSDATSITISPTAPGSPSNGELWFDSDDELLKIYSSGSWINLTGAKTLDELEDVDLTVVPLDGDVLKYNASASVWTSGSVAAGGATVTISDNPPASPEHGDLWFESDSLDLYIYYNDAFLQLTDSSSGVTDITDLGDVLIDNPLIGEALVYNGAEWINQAVASASVALDSLTDVVITSPTNGQILKYNGTQWINDTGAGTGITDSDDVPEGSANLYFTEGRVINALPQDISASASPTFNTVNADLSGNASTATALETAQTIAITGDVSGSASFDGSASISINATIQPNSVALGTDTIGNYVSDVTAGTGVSVTHTPGEGSSPTVAIGQDVSTSASVTFAHVSSDVTGDLTGNADTATALETARTIELSGDVSGSALFDGTSNINITTVVNTSSVAIGELAGVVITDPEEFQTLEFNGVNWVNAYSPVVSYVRNAEVNTLTTGTVVYLFGGTGDHATIKRADNSSDITSSKTVGLVGANIAASENGPVITRGYVDGVNLTAYSPGDVLWLGKSGQFTTTKPSAPDHLVFVGVVVRATNNGIVYVATQNGYEIEELHDVKINGVTNGQFLRYNSASAVWVNDTIDLGADTAGDYVQNLVAGTGVTLTNNSGEGSTPTVAIGQDVSTSASPVFSQVETTHNLIVGGSLYVSGSVVTENQVSLTLDDPFIYLNGGSTETNPDLGIAGNYNDGSYKHAGLFRDATDGKFKFFDSYTPEPSNPIDVSHGSYSPAPVVAETFESTVSTGTAPFTVSSTTEVANLHADTATSLHTSRAISLAGDISGSVAFDGSSDVVLTATVQPNSVALGTDTTGNYLVDLAEGTGVTIIHTPGEGSTASVSIGQSVATSASVTFAHVSADLSGNVTGDLFGNADTATTLETARTIQLSGDVSGSVIFDGSANATITTEIQPDSVVLGDIGDVNVSTATPGDVLSFDGSQWVSASVSAGSSLTVSDTPPASPSSGNLWFESDTTRTYVYYDSAWVEIGSTGSGATVSDTAPTSPVQGQIWLNSLNGATYVYYDPVWIEVGAVPINALLSTIQAKGDLLVGTAAASVDNLGAGTTGQVLTVDPTTATGLKWAAIPPSGGLNTATDGALFIMDIGV